MADEQTADFFAGLDEAPPPVPQQPPPPADTFDDNDFMMDFASSTPATAPPPPPPENYVGEVVEDNAFVLPPSNEQAPESANYDEPIILGAPTSYEPMYDAPAPTDYAAPPDFAAPVEADNSAPIILGEAPPPVLVGDSPEDLPAPVQEPEEPSPLAKWNEQWQVTLRERKEHENEVKAEQVNTARSETDAFLEERAVKLTSRQSNNRTAEEEKLRSMQEDLEKDNSWQRVVKMVELTQDSVEKSAEIKRMRDMLIFLKNDTERAVLLS